MRKFLPRFFNVISFLLALLLFFPWVSIHNAFESLYTKTSFQAFDFISNLTDIEYSGFRLYAIPAVLVVISIIYLITAAIDHAIKKHNKWTSRPIENTIYAPLYYMGIGASISAVIYFTIATIFASDAAQTYGLMVVASDWWTLGGLLLKIEALKTFGLQSVLGIAIFGVLLLLQIVFATTIPKSTRRKGFVAKFFTWLLFLILAFISLKGISLYYSEAPEALSDAFMSLNPSNDLAGLNLYQAKSFITNIDVYIFLGVAVIAFILYIIIGITECHKYNKAYKAAKAMTQSNANNDVPTENENVKEDKNDAENEETAESQNEEERVNQEIFQAPQVEDQGEVQEEKEPEMVEGSNLDEIFKTEFKFQNVSMMSNDGSTDYFVNQVKFLTLSQGTKTMQFRLELDKAIRLVIEYPMIAKDRYENHKVWFRIDDRTILSSDAQIEIVKQAYTAVLNNL